MPNRPEAFQAGVAPLYHGFLPDLDAAHVPTAEAQAAQSKLAACLEVYPALVERCVGKTADEIRETLHALWKVVGAPR